MAKNVPTNIGSGGDSIYTEWPGGTGPVYGVTKIHIGAQDVDGGPITSANPLPVAVSSPTTDTTIASTIAAAAGNVALALSGQSAVAIQITGTWVGTLQFEATVDGTTWQAINAVVAGASTPGPTTTSGGLFRLTPAGVAQIRVNATAWTSGTATVTIRASAAVGGTFLNQSLVAGTNTIGLVKVTDGTNTQQVATAIPAGAAQPGAVVRPYTSSDGTNTTPTMDAATRKAFVALTDGTSTAAVKAASTAVAAADSALAVGLHPSSPLPAGTNSIGTVVLGADPDTVASSTITVTDAVVGIPGGAGVLLNGTSTAGSFLAVLCPGGDTAWTIQVTGTFGGGAVYFEGSLDSTTGADGNWAAFNGRQTGVVNTVLANNTTVAGFFRGNTSGIKYMRVRVVGATAPSITTIIRLSSGPGAMFMNASIPAGLNTIGSVKITDGGGLNSPTVKSASTAAALTDPALVVVQSPNRAEMVGATSALGALNAAALVNAAGFGGVGFFLAAGTLIGTIVAEASYDGGLSSWVPALFDNPTTGQKSSSVVFASANPATSLSIIGNAGASQYRVRVSAFTSGTANGTLRANDTFDPSLLSSSPPNTAVPTVGLQIGASDGTNLQFLRTSPTTQAAGLQGLLVRPYQATDGTNLTPTMDAVARKAFFALTDGTNTAAVKAASTAAATTDPALVVVISPNNAVAITAAALPLPSGAATAANQTTLGSSTSKINDGTNTAAVKAASTAAVATDPALVVSLSPNTRPMCSTDGTNVTPAMAGLSTRGFQQITDGTTNAIIKPGSTAVAAGDTALVVGISPNTPVKTVQQNATATLTNVAAAAVSTAILAANANRKGATIWNDSTSVLYLNFGGTAAATACTVKMRADDYYEVPFGYTGLINGIWVTAAGSARVTEIT